MSDSHDAYLEAQIMTAPPHKLHLMLINGALKFTHRAIELLSTNEQLEAVRMMGRAREIVSEVMVSFRSDDQQLTGRIRRVYLFLFRHLMEAQLEQDLDKLQEVVRVLELESETWQQVCEKNPGSVTVDQPHAVTPSPHAPPTESAVNETPASGSFSIEA